MINAAANDGGFSVHFLYPALTDYLHTSGETSKSLYLFSDPMHFSPAGHEIVARVIHDRIAHRLEQPRANNS